MAGRDCSKSSALRTASAVVAWTAALGASPAPAAAVAVIAAAAAATVGVAGK